MEGLTQGNVSGQGISAMAVGGGVFGVGIGPLELHKRSPETSCRSKRIFKAVNKYSI